MDANSNAGLRELLETLIDGKVTELEARIDSLDRIMGERFDNIQLQFTERNEALLKSETALSKSIEQLSETIALQAKTADEKITILKDLITRSEGIGAGGAFHSANARANWSMVLSVLNFLLLLFVTFSTYIVIK